MSRRCLLLVSLVAGCHSPRSLGSLAPPAVIAAARSSTHAPADWNLDESEAVDLARRNSPVLATRADTERIAREQIGAARQLTNPELRIGQRAEDQLAGGTTHEVAIGVRLHPDLPWAIDARVARARAASDAEHAVTAATSREITARVRTLYAELAFAAATREVLDRELALFEQRRRVLGERLERATATRLEGLLAEQDVADLDAGGSAAELTAVRARGELARLLGIPPGQPWRPVLDLSRLRAVRTGLDAESLSQRALVERPELAEQAARAREADAAEDEERSQRVPWFESVQIERTTGETIEWTIGAAIRLPLLSLNSGRIAAARAERTFHARERERLAATTLREVRDTVEIVELTGARVRELRARIEPLSREIAAVLEQEQAAAVSDPVKLLLLAERQVRSDRSLLAASYEHRVALIALEALTGEAP